MTAPSVADERAFVVQLDDFSGPLDLLLHLIREQEIDIADIPIARVADQFRAAIGELGLNQAAEYIEMAARLLRIKIQMLLPRPLDVDDWEDPRAELVRRLLEYEQIRELSGWLSTRATRRAERFPRGHLPPVPAPPTPEIVVDVESILRTVQEILDALPQPIIHRVVPRPLDVEGATTRIRDLLRANGRIDFREVIGENPHVSDVISALVALLEMARLGQLTLIQPKPFTTFSISRESTHQTA